MRPLTQLVFLLATAFTVFGFAACIKLAYFSIQRDQWFDLLFKWQDKLDRWDGKGLSGSKLHLFLFKAGGGCSTCFSFWLSFLLMPAYYALMSTGFGLWPSGFWGWVAAVVLFQVVLCSTAYLSNLLITGPKK
jgi:hypothetical protein